MRNLSGLARLGIAGLSLAAAAGGAGLFVPGEVGALLRGYGAMLVPAALWLLAGLAVRHVAARRARPAPAAAPLMVSARDGSLRS